MKKRKIPYRTCVVTHEKYEKKDLLRVVRNNEGNVFVDDTHKANGRGAYISKSLSAVDIAQKKKLFDRQLEVEVPQEIYNQLRQIIGEKIER